MTGRGVKRINQCPFIPRPDNQDALIEVNYMLGEKSYIAYGQYKRKEVQGMAFGQRMFAGVAVLLMLLGVMLTVVPYQASAAINPQPAMTLSLSPNIQDVIVTESLKGTLSFDGKVKVDKLPVERIVVTLTPSVDQGWPCSCSPSTIVITDTADHTFGVSVVVPENWLSANSGTLKIDASGRGGGFVVTANSQAIINVKPFYRVMIESDTPYREISPGSQAFFSFKVWNYGNAVDTFELEIVNLKDLVNDHWTVTLSTTQVPRIPVAEYRVVKITAQSPRDWTIWKSKPSIVTVRAISVNARDASLVVNQAFPMYAYEKGFYIPGFDPMFLVLAMGICAVFVARIKRR